MKINIPKYLQKWLIWLKKWQKTHHSCCVDLCARVYVYTCSFYTLFLQKCNFKKL